MNQKNRRFLIIIIILFLLVCVSWYSLHSQTIISQDSNMSENDSTSEENGPESQKQQKEFIVDEQQIIVPLFTDIPYIDINNGEPFFTDEEKQYTYAFEYYSELDDLGRCGPAFANICIELMPTEDRGDIGAVKPSGWQTIKYDIVSGRYLYNRCHLIGFQLAGENANKCNLITGTRYLNIEGMLPFENWVADYVKETNNHVLYRVTPLYENDSNLLCYGVLMEGYSVEDSGDSIMFCIFAYNAQPGIEIDYQTGDSHLMGE